MAAIAFLCGGCDEKSVRQDQVEEKPRRERFHAAGIEGPERSRAHHIHQQAIGELSNDELLMRSLEIITHGDMTPESEQAELLELYLRDLFAANRDYFYQAVEKMRPGYHSSSVVSHVLMHAQLTSVKGLIGILEPIRDTELRKGALEGGLIGMQFLEPGEQAKGLDAEALAYLKDNGVSAQLLADVVKVAYGQGAITLNDVANAIGTNDTILFNRFADAMPVGESKKLLALVSGREDGVDKIALAVFARRLARENAPESISWISTLPGRERGVMMKSAMDEWIAADPIKASESINLLPQGEGRDLSVDLLVGNCLKHGDIASARQWADTISNPDLKRKTLARIEPE